RGDRGRANTRFQVVPARDALGSCLVRRVVSCVIRYRLSRHAVYVITVIIINIRTSVTKDTFIRFSRTNGVFRTRNSPRDVTTRILDSAHRFVESAQDNGLRRSFPTISTRRAPLSKYISVAASSLIPS